MATIKLTKEELLERISKELMLLTLANMTGEWGKEEYSILKDASNIIDSVGDKKNLMDDLCIFADLLSGLLYLHGDEKYKGKKILIPKFDINRAILNIG